MRFSTHDRQHMADSQASCWVSGSDYSYNCRQPDRQHAAFPLRRSQPATDITSSLTTRRRTQQSNTHSRTQLGTHKHTKELVVKEFLSENTRIQLKG